MIKIIIFDVGGIFIRGSFDIFLKKISEMIGVKINMDSRFKKITNNWMRGRFTFKEFIEKISKNHISKKEEKEIFNMWINNWNFDHDMILFAKKFKPKYKLVILSNADAEGVKFRNDDWLNFFDQKFHSFELGMIKPEKEIYEHVLKEIGTKPEECVFIDDKVENIEAAKNLEIHGIVFENKNQLKQELEKLGVVE